MSESMLLWIEIGFNVAYLIVIWGLVIAMIRRQPDVPVEDQKLTQYFIYAFSLLALGDTGHVGFRVMAFALGNLESTFSDFGLQLGLVGLGTLSTAITVTLFYVLMVVIWHERYKKTLWLVWLFTVRSSHNPVFDHGAARQYVEQRGSTSTDVVVPQFLLDILRFGRRISHLAGFNRG